MVVPLVLLNLALLARAFETFLAITELGNKKSGRKELSASSGVLDDLQERLFAAHRDEGSGPSLLLPAMDTVGKGGIVRHVVGSVDPQGVGFAAFKKPTPEELAHDFLWRIRRRVPGPGMIGVFDRSHYEDVRIIKVMLHISPDEQKGRLMERLDRHDKHWKYDPGDMDERLLGPDYMKAYQTAVDRTSTEAAPVPADRKQYA